MTVPPTQLPPIPDDLAHCELLGLTPSFGFGDRLGTATPGHVAAMKRAGKGMLPIFPQQSIREMARTQRTAEQVMRDALVGMNAAGWDGPTGADADHLKTTADIDVTTAVGFTFFTLDPSDYVDGQADDYTESKLREKFAAIASEVDWFDSYLGQKVDLPTGTVIELTEEACLRAAVKYGRALNHSLALGHHLDHVQTARGRDYEIELSIDETAQPTTLGEHYIIANQCLGRGMRLVSLAPRFVGDFEKGVDFKGDLSALDASLKDHAALANLLGPYKLSLHSGSDKLSMYAAFARATEGKFHVKTAGTSYLEALRVVVRHDLPLFRQIVDFCRARYERDKATYHVSARLAGVPESNQLGSAEEFEKTYLERWADVPAGKGFTEPGRQILHCTFGSVLTDAELGPAVRGCLEMHADTYTEVLADHFARHLEALQSGMS